MKGLTYCIPGEMGLIVLTCCEGVNVLCCRFQEKGVKDVVKDVFLPWFNAYRFLIQNILRLQQVSGERGFLMLQLILVTQI